MRFGPPVAFVRRADGHNIAYQVLGDADLDLVFLVGYATHLGLLWENRDLAQFLRGLASFSRLIVMDRLGNGLSDRGPSGQTFEEDMDDVRLVLDTVGSERTAFFGTHLGGRMALLFAATYPARTRAVVTFAAHPASLRDEDFPWGSSQEQHEALLESIRHGPPDPIASMTRLTPGVAADPSFLEWWRMFYLSAVTPPEAYDFVALLAKVDIRRFLGAVRVPTLLLHRTADPLDRRAHQPLHGRADPGGQAGGVAGDDHLPFLGDQDSVVALVQEFLTGTLPVPDPDRVLATGAVHRHRGLHPAGDPARRPALASHPGEAQRGGARQSGPLPRPGGQDHR
jgi:pimeloyl-ACP methyl ester carboxylesterase